MKVLHLKIFLVVDASFPIFIAHEQRIFGNIGKFYNSCKDRLLSVCHKLGMYKSFLHSLYFHLLHATYHDLPFLRREG